MGSLSSDARVLQYFAQRAPGKTLGTTQILKLAYLADLCAREYLGHPLTHFDYRWYKHGPFDRGIYDAIDELESEKLVKQIRHLLPTDRVKREVACTQEVDDLGFADAELSILDHVAGRYAALSLDDLLKEVYATEPMRIAQAREAQGRRLPMEERNYALRDSLGVDLEAVVREEREVEHGNSVLADDFFDALQTEALAWDRGEH